MTGEIIAQIWQLSWYQVLVIAIADDVILIVKLWPVWAGILGACLYFSLISICKRYAKIRKRRKSG